MASRPWRRHRQPQPGLQAAPHRYVRDRPADCAGCGARRRGLALRRLERWRSYRSRPRPTAGGRVESSVALASHRIRVHPSGRCGSVGLAGRGDLVRLRCARRRRCVDRGARPSPTFRLGGLRRRRTRRGADRSPRRKHRLPACIDLRHGLEHEFRLVRASGFRLRIVRPRRAHRRHLQPRRPRHDRVRPAVENG